MTHVPKDTHPWNSLHPEDRFPESKSGAGVEAGATLRVSSPPTWTWEGLWKRVQRKRPPMYTGGWSRLEGTEFPIGLGLQVQVGRDWTKHWPECLETCIPVPTQPCLLSGQVLFLIQT